MSKTHLDLAIQQTALDVHAYWAAKGEWPAEGWTRTIVHPWAICLEQAVFRDQPDLEASLMRAFRELDDELAQAYSGEVKAWDEWELFAWQRALRRLGDRLEPYRHERCREVLLRFADYMMSICIEMESFDGAIPNHGIWNHVLFHEVGLRYNRQDYVDMARHALARVLASQTPDGCFREGGSSSGMHGTAVTGYNLVSLLAINVYYGQAQDPAAAEALEKGWHWWYDYLFPDMTMPPALDCRQVYSHGHEWPDDVHPLCVPAYFFNKPELRAYAAAGWRLRTERQGTVHTGPYRTHSLSFIAMQYDMIEDDVSPEPREWPEYQRMIAEEACIRRRNGWHAVLCGITNRQHSSVVLPFWRLERQQLLNIWHQDHGLIAGAAHSLIQEELSTFTFYQNGAAYYLHEHAYLKSTPPLDSLLVSYGGNVGAVSVDTRETQRCTLIFSLDGERGLSPAPGLGHPGAAMAARARLALRPKAGDTIQLDDRSWVLEPDRGLRLEIEQDQRLACRGWSVHCPDGPWVFQWPVRTADPYQPLSKAEHVALAEIVLYRQITVGEPRPTGSLVIELD